MTMTVRIEVEPQAMAELDELDAWWREHRPDSWTSVLTTKSLAARCSRSLPFGAACAVKEG